MAIRTDVLLKRASEAQRASKRVAIRQSFGGSEADWVELIKDVVALANSGGGVIVFEGPAPGLNRAALRDALARYARTDFDDYEVVEVSRDGRTAPVVLVGPADDAPIAFTREGRYVDEAGREQVAFTRGAVFFRHGGKSGPATNEDLRAYVEQRVRSLRRRWFGDIRRVMTEAEGPQIAVRLTADPDAPVYGQIDADRSHPYRQKEVVREVNARLPEGVTITPYDVLSVRRVHGIDEESHPEFAHIPKFGTTQYSDAFVDWLVAQFERDPEFFDAAKAEYRASRRRH